MFSDPYALYHFGYGLSYSSFEYTGMDVRTVDGPDDSAAGAASADDTVKVKVSVKNTSDKVGKEVVQIYSADVASSHITPVKKLVAYEKVEILPAEEKTVELSIPVSRLGFYDRNMNLRVEPGDFRIMAGSSSDSIHFTETVTVAGENLFRLSETDNAGATQNVGKSINVTVVVRDVQASVLEGVAVNAAGKTLAVTDAEGKCSIRTHVGARVILTKKGYKPLEMTVGQDARLEATFIPEI